MMRVRLNGEERETAEGTTVAELLAEAGLGTEAGAVAVNMAVVPRSRIKAMRLNDGDQVEVIEAVGGG